MRYVVWIAIAGIAGWSLALALSSDRWQVAAVVPGQLRGGVVLRPAPGAGPELVAITGEGLAHRLRLESYGLVVEGSPGAVSSRPVAWVTIPGVAGQPDRLLVHTQSIGSRAHLARFTPRPGEAWFVEEASIRRGSPAQFLEGIAPRQAGCEGPAAVLLLTDGGATFELHGGQVQLTSLLVPTAYRSGAALADVSGDGVADLVVCPPGELMALEAHPGTPTGEIQPDNLWQAQVRLDSLLSRDSRIAVLPDGGSGGEPVVLVAARAGGDLPSWQLCAVSMTEGSPHVSSLLKRSEPLTLLPLDVDGDGIEEVMAATPHASWVVDGSGQGPVLLAGPPLPGILHAGGDLSGNGWPDLVTGARLQIVPGVGPGKWIPVPFSRRLRLLTVWLAPISLAVLFALMALEVKRWVKVSWRQRDARKEHRGLDERIDDLEHPDPQRRRMAIESLAFRRGTAAGYDPARSPSEQAEVISAWRSWWLDQVASRGGE